MKSKHYIFITIVITSCLLTACSRTEAEPEAPPAIDVEGIIGRAESLYREREDLEKLRAAIAELDTARHHDRRSFEIEWRVAKYCYMLGTADPESSDAGEILEKGRDAGNIASRIEPQRPEGYFWYGANLGQLAKRSPVTVGLRALDDIRDSMKKVIELQPDYQGGGAFIGLGQLELESRMFGGSTEKAIEYLEKGLAIEKRNANIHLQLAKAYLAAKRKDDAKAQLQDLLTMQPNPDYLPEHKRAVDEGRELLKRRF